MAAEITEEKELAILSVASDAIEKVFKDWIDERCTQFGESRRTLALIAGKAMIMSGCCFIGNALNLKEESSIAIGKACLIEFQKLAKSLSR